MKPNAAIAVSPFMLAFLDFEASSLAKRSYPIEVAWIFEDGAKEAHLIRPAPGWTDWDLQAEAIHHISRDQLAREGEPHDVVACLMIERLAAHDLLASAPSWDGKWLSALLRAADLPRHALRLRDSDLALRESAAAILAPVIPPERLAFTIDALIADILAARPAPMHRALADAEQEHACWLTLRAAAEALAAGQAPYC